MKAKYSIEELERMIDTHSILPDGTVVTKAEAKRYYKKQHSCICMDCGKIIKVAEQSEHISKCPRKDLTPRFFKRNRGSGKLTTKKLKEEFGICPQEGNMI